ncbi:ferredoxin [Streptomyces sp. BK340]|uniref:ferredoxin n=1 Tax=Streptomyces sp. BK340 TaxID=2572903 RepID=UPI0011A2EF7F|nr:ferredoxin [Streptomyces sp. BK340]TVZ90353.1 ferredoxin [Streptomyces sp. BK340]
MKVTVDIHRCCSSGLCVTKAPDVFDQDPDDGAVVLLDPAPAAVHQPAVRLAASCCPGRAITVTDTHRD